MTNHKTLSIEVVLTTVLLCASFVHADGKLFRGQLDTDEPGIRAQRATIFFQDGVETLIVQSDIERAGKEMGWLLPLPSPPTNIEACEPYALTSLVSAIQPEIAQDSELLLMASLFLLALVCLLAVDRMYQRDRGQHRFSVSRAALVTVFLMGTVFVFLPSLSVSGWMQGASVLQTSRVGVYDVTILRGDTTSDITDWLDSNGFAWSPEAEQVLSDYVADG